MSNKKISQYPENTTPSGSDIFVTVAGGVTKKIQLSTLNQVITGNTDTFITGGSYSNGTLYLNNNTGGTIDVTGVTTESITTNDVVAMVQVGAVGIGDTIPSGTTLQGLTNLLFLTTFYPTYSVPSFSLTSNQSSGQEIGTTVTLTLTYNFNRGSINGDLVGSIWNPSAFQDYRAGIANDYIIEGNDTGLVNNYTINSYVLSGTQTFNGSVSYDIGPQPKDSDNNNYDTPYAAGTQSRSVTITAIYPYFWGKVTGGSKPTKDQALIDSGNKVVASSTGTLTINYSSTSNDWLWFAIPQTSTSKTKWYVNALNNGSIGGGGNLFDTEELISVDSLDIYWNGINYKIYMSNYKSEVLTSMELRNS